MGSKGLAIRLKYYRKISVTVFVDDCVINGLFVIRIHFTKLKGNINALLGPLQIISLIQI